MHEWREMGHLGRAATVSLWGGMFGPILAVATFKISGSTAAGVTVGALWYAPALLWAFAVWSTAARHHFGVTIAVMAGLCAIGVFTLPPDEAELLPLFLITLSGLTAFLALGGNAAQAMLDWGRE